MGCTIEENKVCDVPSPWQAHSAMSVSQEMLPLADVAPLGPPCPILLDPWALTLQGLLSCALLSSSWWQPVKAESWKFCHFGQAT